MVDYISHKTLTTTDKIIANSANTLKSMMIFLNIFIGVYLLNIVVLVSAL